MRLGDLISREALRNEVDTWGCNDYDKYDFLEAIENAPSVELFCSYLSDGEVRQPCVETPCKHERPQGEWIRRKMNWYICSNCNYKTDSIGETFFSFCPNCGADMRGDKE